MRKKCKTNIKSKFENNYVYEAKQTESITYQNNNREYPNVLQYAETELGIVYFAF